MDRKRSVKMVRTPDTSTIPMDDNTLLFNTPQKSKPKHIPSFETSAFHTTLSSTNFKPYIVGIVLFLLLALQYFRNDGKEVIRLENSLDSLKHENKELKSKYDAIKKKIDEHRHIIDYASIEHGAYIDYNNTSSPFKYGFLGQKYKDASIVLYGLSRAGECFSFYGNTGMLTLMFKNNIRIKEIVLAHPMTNDRRSAIKEFNLYGIRDDRRVSLGKYNFDLDLKVAHGYKIYGSVLYSGIIIEVLNNHGKSKYTCIYKVSVLGHPDE